MDKLKEDLNGLQLWLLKTCCPNTSKPRAVVILSSERRAAGKKVKLCKLSVPRRSLLACACDLLCL